MARKFIATHRKTKLKVTLDEAGAADYRKKKLNYDIEEIPEKEKAAEPTEAKRGEVDLRAAAKAANAANDAENKRG